MSRVLVLLAALVGFALPSPAFAYWEYGHQSVARIAYANVRPQTRAAIREILSHQALLGTPACPAGTIEEASTWADCIKKLGPDFKYAYNWHFVDTEICKPYDPVSVCKDGNCATAQIERDVALLKNRRTPMAERVKALAFLVHFVGDLQQPLHASDHDDQGGNKEPASYGIYAPARFNLHSVWDGPLAERAITTGPSIFRRYSAAERKRLAAGSVADWARQSWEVARKDVYGSLTGGDPCAPLPNPAKFDDALVAKLVPVARLQVQRGGLRLAKLLDRALG